MTKPWHWFVVLLIALMPGCPALGNEIRMTDDTGYELVMPGPARRIVSLAPHITESLFAVGAGELIVATVSYSDYPEAAGDIPVIGSYDRINLESLLLTEPDLVLGWKSGNGEAVLNHIRQLGVKVFISEPRKLTDIAKTLDQFSALAGSDDTGRQTRQAFEKRLETLRQTYSDKRTVTVFYQVWNEPLLTLNGEHLLSDVIRLCGGHNVFSDARPLVPTISPESVLKADPEVIIASGMGEERPDWLDHWRRWSKLRATRNDQLYFIPPALLQRHSTRILDGAEKMCGFLERTRQRPAGDS
jgi:iron complex transport system substrate-binding protein